MEKDIVFIDTSVFIQSQYFKKSNSLWQLKELSSENLINILLTQITKAEIIKHIRKDLSERFSRIKSEEKWLNAFPQLLVPSNAIELDAETEAKKYIENYISLSNAYVIPYSYCQDVEDVFDKYFSKSKPFGNGKEKEFPDAFALQALETYAKQAEISKIIILSYDADLKHYPSDILQWVDVKEYVDMKLRERDQLHKYISSFEDDYEKIFSVIEDHIFSEFCDDAPFYYEEDKSLNIESKEFTECQVEKITKKHVIESTPAKLTFEVFAQASLCIEYEFSDYTNAIHDTEDDVWYGEESGSGHAYSNGIIKVQISCSKEIDNSLNNYQIIEYDYTALEEFYDIREMSGY